jgi:hypothetical protein
MPAKGRVSSRACSRANALSSVATMAGPVSAPVSSSTGCNRPGRPPPGAVTQTRTRTPSILP